MDLKGEWTGEKYALFNEYLITLSNEKIKKFSEKLIKTNLKVLGLTNPIIRSIAKDIEKGDPSGFLSIANPTDSYEINLIYGLVSAHTKDFDLKLSRIENFLNSIDNWASCDVCVGDFKIKQTDEDKLFEFIEKYIESDKTYHARAAIVMLMKFFINERFIDKSLELTKKVKCGEYYIDMALAWFYAECLGKQPKKSIEFLKSAQLPQSVLSKTAQKARDSFRVSKEIKEEITMISRRKKGMENDG